MITPVPITSTGFCLVQGRIGLGSRSVAKTRTMESSGPAARAGDASKVRAARLSSHGSLLMKGSPRIMGPVMRGGGDSGGNVAPGITPVSPRAAERDSPLAFARVGLRSAVGGPIIL